jgi:hypothetical protein
MGLQLEVEAATLGPGKPSRLRGELTGLRWQRCFLTSVNNQA